MLEQARLDNEKLGQSYKTIRYGIDSKKLKQGPWRSGFCKKLEKLLKEIIQINYDQHLQKSILEYVHRWAFGQLSQNGLAVLEDKD